MFIYQNTYSSALPYRILCSMHIICPIWEGYDATKENFDIQNLFGEPLSEYEK